LNEDISKK
jgi:hypothetical protein